jgi:hypothetical protein
LEEAAVQPECDADDAGTPIMFAMRMLQAHWLTAELKSLVNWR